MPEENQRLQQGCVVVLEWESIALFIRRRKGSYFVGFFLVVRICFEEMDKTEMQLRYIRK